MSLTNLWPGSCQEISKIRFPQGRPLGASGMMMPTSASKRDICLEHVNIRICKVVTRLTSLNELLWFEIKVDG